MPDAGQGLAFASRPIHIGTRGSALARWQADHVRKLLIAAHSGLNVEIEVIVTQGDRVLDVPLPLIGGKGLFTAELERALHDGTIDLAVHSLKDLPTQHPEGLTLGATPPRADPRDVIVSRDRHTLRTMPPGATVGTSSLRRMAQLRRLRPDLSILDVRGNIDTRIRKAIDADGPYDAIVLAAAGLERLDRLDAVSAFLSVEDMLPAPGQAALALQCRDEPAILELLAPLNDEPTSICVAAERAFLAGLGGGCSVPVAALGTISGGEFTLRGRVSSTDGREQIDVSLTKPIAFLSAEHAGAELAHLAIARGAAAFLEVHR